ncbi:MAG: serine/threonine-protein kinase [Gaiellaceae bacterium]
MSWDIPIGTEFAGYRITSVLGRGGMSVVFAAEHATLGRTVALKLLSPALAADESFRERFARESQLAATLDHPNIIPIYDAGEAEGFLYIAMRHVDGQDLGSLLEQEGPLSLPQTLFYIEQVAAALDHAHEQGLVHRDIKPANVMIAKPSDRVYLTDFGVAKQTSTAGLTKTGYFLGTFEYAAPEQIEGRPVDGRTDQYALGCVLYECLSGEPPFEAKTEASVIHAHLVEPPPKVTAKRSDLPFGINDVVTTAMAKSKEDRYSSCGDLTRALRSIALGTVASERSVAPAGATVQASSGTVLSKPGTAEAESVAAEPPPTAPRPRRTFTFSGRRLVAFAVLAALVIGGAVAAVVLLTGSGSGKSSSANSGGGTPSHTTGMAAVVPNDLLKYCKKATPQLGAAQTETCTSPSNVSFFLPDTWQFSLFRDTAGLMSAYNTLRNQALVQRQNFGGCSGLVWGGEGQWYHPSVTNPGQLGPFAGRRFCYFTTPQREPTIVWTHEKLGQSNHIDFLGVARASDPAAHTDLFGWWRFWHHRLGHCEPKKTCSAKL